MSELLGIQLPSDWKALLQLLDKHQVRYLIVGGVAANFHGQPRFTQDIDFFLDRSEENAMQILRALEEFGFGSLALGIEDFVKPNFVVQLGVPPNRVDFLTDIAGLDFASAWDRRVNLSFEDFSIQIVSKLDLITSKKSAGRPKDLADVSVLEKQKK